MSRSVDEDSYPETYMDPGPGEDEHLEADYEDRNGDPHGVGSPEYEDGDEGGWDDDLEYEDDEPDTYCGTYVPKGIDDDPIGRQPFES